MVTVMKTEHPSNRLARGEIRDFLTATEVYLDAIRFELRMGDASLEERGFWQRERLSAQAAADVFAEVMRDAEVDVIARLRLAGLDIWGDALQHGDYKELAI